MAILSSAVPAAAGTGARCPEAQADGVPCQDLGRDCEICVRTEHALVAIMPAPPPAIVMPRITLPGGPHA